VSAHAVFINDSSVRARLWETRCALRLSSRRFPREYIARKHDARGALLILEDSLLETGRQASLTASKGDPMYFLSLYESDWGTGIKLL